MALKKDGERTMMTLSVAKTTRQFLDNEVKRTNKSRGKIVDELVNNKLEVLK